MIVCLCVGVNDRDIVGAITDGAHTVDQIGACSGAGTGCGACREFIQDMLDEAGAGCPGKGQCGMCRSACEPRQAVARHAEAPQQAA